MTKIRANRLDEWCKTRKMNLRALHQEMLNQGLKIDYANLSSMKNHSRPIPKKFYHGLAKALKIDIDQLFHAHFKGMEEEFSPWQAPKHHILEALNTDDTKYIAKIYKNILDEVNIYPRDILIFDLSKKAFEGLKDRDIVMAQLYDDDYPQNTKTIIRQYISPNLLITNSALTANKITHLQQGNAQIKAVMSDLYRSKNQA